MNVLTSALRSGVLGATSGVLVALAMGLVFSGTVQGGWGTTLLIGIVGGFVSGFLQTLVSAALDRVWPPPGP
jgi:hypothetical protein